MPLFEVTCFETIRLTRTYEADTPQQAKEMAEADIEIQGWDQWDEDTLGTNGVEMATDLDTQETTVFDEQE